MEQTIKGICINSDGNITLKDIKLVKDRFDILDICDTNFKCDFCGSYLSYSKGSAGPLFVREKPSESFGFFSWFSTKRQYYTYVLFFQFPHDENEDSKCPINPFSDKCLSHSCGCGYEEHNHTYRGKFYLIKYDSSLKIKDKMINCDENDLTHINLQLKDK